MSDQLIQDYEHTGAHIKEYLEDSKLFDIFYIDDIKNILKHANLSSFDFLQLLEQSPSTLKVSQLYKCIRGSNIYVDSYQEAVSALKSIQKYLKLSLLNGIISVLDNTEKEMSEPIQNQQQELNKIIDQNKKLENQIQQLQSQIQDYNNNTKLLSMINELKNSNDFKAVHNFLNGLSKDGNQTIMIRARQEGLCEMKNNHKRDALLEASIKGNIRLVKSLIECGCNKETQDKNGKTPLIFASEKGHLKVVNYLLSIGVNKDATDIKGYSPLIYAISNGNTELVKCIIAAGANKDAEDKNGFTPLIFSVANNQLEVVKCLISLGANKNAKNKEGCTPLSYARGKVREYLISIGAK